MASQFPTALDSLLAGNTATDKDIKAAIDALQAKFQRTLKSQANATPAGAGTVTPDMSLGCQLAIQMPAGNITIANPINAVLGDTLTLVITQDAVGTRTITWGNAFKKSLSLSIAGNARDAVTFKYDGTNWNQIGSSLAQS